MLYNVFGLWGHLVFSVADRYFAPGHLILLDILEYLLDAGVIERRDADQQFEENDSYTPIIDGAGGKALAIQNLRGDIIGSAYDPDLAVLVLTFA